MKYEISWYYYFLLKIPSNFVLKYKSILDYDSYRVVLIKEKKKKEKKLISSFRKFHDATNTFP